MRRAALVLAVGLAACASNQSWRRVAPDLPPDPPAVVSPRIERVEVAGGAAVLHVPRAGSTVAIGLALRTAPHIDPGLTGFTLELVARGPDRAVEAAIGELGGAIEPRWLGDGAALVAEVEASQWSQAVELMAAAVRAPNFTDADVEELRGERLAAIQRRDGDPAAQGLHVLLSRFAAPLDDLGERAPTEQITADIARSIHATLMKSGSPALIVVGDVPRAQLREVAARALADWRGPAGAPTTAVRNVEPRGDVFVVPRPGLAQTAIVLGRAVRGAGADDLALELAGATVASALRDVLRRERGDTYSVAVTHLTARSGGLLAIQTQVDAAATGAALRSMFAALRDLQGRFITGDTLRLLGRAFQIERMLDRQRSAAVALAVARQVVLGLEGDTLAADLRTLGSMPGGQVERALASFAPADLQIVLVGDPEVIAAQVAPLGLGRLRVLPAGRW